jgi:SAM-dependent MidA family methyltransferase
MNLKDRIRRLIRTDGPMSVSDYMAMCLFDPENGYYTTREPFGEGGDFVTAPEISQMFGEMVGAWLVHAWRALGRPQPFALVEMGPGRGTLMRDIMRTARIDPAFLAAAQVHLVETSERLRGVQAETLVPLAVHWHSELTTLPTVPMLFVANELFDAVPVRQFEQTPNGWCERRVGLDADGNLAFVPGLPVSDPSLLPPGADAAPEGAVFEYAPAREAIAANLGERLTAHGGTALVIDYGHIRSGFADTLQALRAHHFVSVFHEPGSADLTSHVDFESLGRAAESAGATALPAMTQGDFLLSLGLAERAGALGHGKDEKTQAEIRAAAERLAGTGKAQMGGLFKVLCLTGAPLALPPFT